jgi:hypothetical protein
MATSATDPTPHAGTLTVDPGCGFTLDTDLGMISGFVIPGRGEMHGILQADGSPPFYRALGNQPVVASVVLKKQNPAAFTLTVNGTHGVSLTGYGTFSSGPTASVTGPFSVNLVPTFTNGRASATTFPDMAGYSFPMASFITVGPFNANGLASLSVVFAGLTGAPAAFAGGQTLTGTALQLSADGTTAIVVNVPGSSRGRLAVGTLGGPAAPLADGLYALNFIGVPTTPGQSRVSAQLAGG